MKTFVSILTLAMLLGTQPANAAKKDTTPPLPTGATVAGVIQKVSAQGLVIEDGTARFGKTMVFRNKAGRLMPPFPLVVGLPVAIRAISVPGKEGMEIVEIWLMQ